MIAIGNTYKFRWINPDAGCRWKVKQVMQLQAALPYLSIIDPAGHHSQLLHQAGGEAQLQQLGLYRHLGQLQHLTGRAALPGRVVRVVVFCVQVLG